jgi:HEAT repeat protein
MATPLPRIGGPAIFVVMATRSSLEDDLAELKRLRQQGNSPEALDRLRKALSGRVSLLAARAAEIAGEFAAEPLTGAMEQAFGRFMANPVKTDKGCQAKTAVADALYRIGASSADVFIRGVRHVQMEPSFGGPIDTAARLRGLCALGLVRMNHPAAMNELARLLADREADARIMAARAIAYAGDGGGEPLLRYKAHCGDADPLVLAECFLALLRLSPAASLEFVAGYLDSGKPDTVESAAIAMGESRNPDSLPPLQAAYGRTVDADARRIILSAIAALRCDKAIDFLLGELANATGKTAEIVLSALAAYKHDPAVRERVAARVDQSRDRQLAKAFQASFGS